MEKIADILHRSLKRLPVTNRRLEDYAVWSVWNDTVGPTVARNAQPEKLRHGTLVVKVSAPTWMQQLQYMKELIATKLNERLGRPVVDKIFFVLGTLPAVEPAERPASEAPVDASAVPDAELRAIKDPALRDGLRRLMAAHLKRRRG